VPLELPAAIHFLWLKHTANQAILSELEGVYGKDVIALRAVEEWTAAFDGGRTEPADLHSCGRPRNTGKVDVVCALIEGGGYLSPKKIAQMLGVYHETIEHILGDELNMRKVNFNWVLHALDSSEKAVGVQVLREPFDFPESHPA
jgi:hypothetical protein